ncbi:MAG: hypothetical protein JXM73_16125 [Anaerolineae bacterium]|nr:hypothetical protein [Anaerolineae bacterium]
MDSIGQKPEQVKSGAGGERSSGSCAVGLRRLERPDAVARQRGAVVPCAGSASGSRNRGARPQARDDLFRWG